MTTLTSRDYIKIAYYTTLLIAATTLLFLNYHPHTKKVEEASNQIIKVIGYMTVNYIMLECLWHKLDIIFRDRRAA